MSEKIEKDVKIYIPKGRSGSGNTPQDQSLSAQSEQRP